MHRGVRDLDEYFFLKPQNLSYILGIEDQAHMLYYLIFMVFVSCEPGKTWPSL